MTHSRRPADQNYSSRGRGRPRREVDPVRLAEVVTQLFEEGGYDAVSIEATAAALSISRATLYRSVASKDHLMGAVLESATDDLCNAAEVILAKADVGPRLRVEQLMRMQVEFSLHRPRCLLALLTGADVPVAIARRQQLGRRRYEEKWLRAIRAAVKTGDLPADDPRVIARLITGMTMVMPGTMPHSRFGPAYVAATAARLVLTQRADSQYHHADPPSEPSASGRRQRRKVSGRETGLSA